MSVKTGEHFIGGSDGKFYQWTGESAVEAKGFRGYLATEDENSEAKTLSVGMQSAEDGGDSTTFIEGLTIDSRGNLIQQSADGKVYSLSGQQMKGSFSSLPGGVYVVNGKKYVK